MLVSSTSLCSNQFLMMCVANDFQSSLVQYEYSKVYLASLHIIHKWCHHKYCFTTNNAVCNHVHIEHVSWATKLQRKKSCSVVLDQ